MLTDAFAVFLLISAALTQVGPARDTPEDVPRNPAAPSASPPRTAVSLEEYSTNHVTHGPMLGLVTDHSVRVWARTLKAGEFTVHYGVNAENLDQTSAPVITTASHDHAAATALIGLKPQTHYHYQVYIGKVPSGPAGSFWTLPSAEMHREATHNPRGLFNYRLSGKEAYGVFVDSKSQFVGPKIAWLGSESGVPSDFRCDRRERRSLSRVQRDSLHVIAHGLFRRRVCVD